MKNLIDVNLQSCVIKSSKFIIDIMPIVVELNYYEDIFCNSIYGNILINDSGAFHSQYEWIGEEYLILSFSNDPSEGTNENLITKVLRIYSVSERTTHHNTNESYILNFCSEEFLLAQKIRISRTYKNAKISDIVKRIAFDYLKINPKEFPDDHIDPTMGTYDITIPNLKPLQAINWLCNFAISENLPQNRSSGASYLFWQNKDGYYFKSVLNIFNDIDKYLYTREKPSNGYWYGMKNVDMSSIQNEPIKDSEHIIAYKILDTYNSLRNVKNGVFSNKTISLDFLRREATTSVFDYENYYSNYIKKHIDLYKKENPHSIMPTTHDRFDKKYNEYSDSLIKVIPTTTNQNTNKYIKANKNDIKDGNLEYTIPYRIAQLGLLRLNRIQLMLPGDQNIMIGHLVKINIPQATALDNDIKDNKFLTGIYLVTAVRHMINKNNDFRTILEVRKDSYVEGLENVDNYSDSIYRSLK